MVDKSFLKNVGVFFAYIISLVVMEFLVSLNLPQFTGGWFITIWIFLSFVPLIIAWPFSCYDVYWQARSEQTKRLTHKFLYWYATFGRRLWSFDNLWFMVFLIGFYATIATVAKEVIIQNQSLGSVEIWIQALENILIAAFLSVITSVVSHMFIGTETTSEKLESASIILKECVPIIEESKELIQRTCDDLAIVTSNLDAAEAQQDIRSARQTISDDYNETKENLKKLVSNYNNYTQSCFNLLSPFGSFTEYIKDNKNLPRLSYVSAILARYFASEIETRGAPGVYLNVSSFTFYVRTVMEVIESLRKWWQNYEFYTTVPNRPSDIFRFQTSAETDIKEWFEFLSYYHKFQQDGTGKWQRFFLYSTTKATQPAASEVKASSVKFDYPSLVEIERDLNHAIVVVQSKNSWIPKELDSITINKYINAIQGQEDKDDTMKCNSINGGKGTLVLYNKSGQAVKEDEWMTFESCLLNYQVNEEKFRYKNVDDIEKYFQQELDIVRTLNGKGSIAKTARFKLPRDIFAVKEIKSDGNGRWILVIAREIGNKQMSSLGLTFSPILELDMMDNTPNKNIAETIGKMLEEIFSNTKSLTHSTLRKYHIQENIPPNV